MFSFFLNTKSSSVLWWKGSAENATGPLGWRQHHTLEAFSKNQDLYFKCYPFIQTLKLCLEIVTSDFKNKTCNRNTACMNVRQWWRPGCSVRLCRGRVNCDTLAGGVNLKLKPSFVPVAAAEWWLSTEISCVSSWFPAQSEEIPQAKADPTNEPYSSVAVWHTGFIFCGRTETNSLFEGSVLYTSVSLLSFIKKQNTSIFILSHRFPSWSAQDNSKWSSVTLHGINECTNSKLHTFHKYRCKTSAPPSAF